METRQVLEYYQKQGFGWKTYQDFFNLAPVALESANSFINRLPAKFGTSGWHESVKEVRHIIGEGKVKLHTKTLEGINFKYLANSYLQLYYKAGTLAERPADIANCRKEVLTLLGEMEGTAIKKASESPKNEDYIGHDRLIWQENEVSLPDGFLVNFEPHRVEIAGCYDAQAGTNIKQANRLSPFFGLLRKNNFALEGLRQLFWPERDRITLVDEIRFCLAVSHNNDPFGEASMRRPKQLKEAGWEVIETCLSQDRILQHTLWVVQTKGRQHSRTLYGNVLS